MRDSKQYTIMDAKGATGIGNIIFVRDFRNVILTFDTDGGGDAAMTAKVQGAITETAPTFTSAQSPSNNWDYIQMKDLEDGSTVDGDTGFVVATADDNRMFEVNTNGIEWLTVRITAVTAGELTVKVRAFDNQ